MGNLFDLIEPAARGPVPNDNWRPEPPPSLDGEKEIVVNFETTGLRWFDGDKPLSVAVYAKGRSWYLPFGHAGSGNLPEEQVYRFCQNEFKGKHIRNINTRFDIHMARVWGERMGSGGLNFDEMGCAVSDVSHYAALLDDHRTFMNLDSLITDFLKEQPMLRLDESRMASYAAGHAAPRAMYNVEAVHRLKELMWPMLDEQGLQRVRQLEDDVIFPVVEMEKNATLINVPLLEQWIKETLNRYHKVIMDIYKATGLKITPGSTKDEQKLFAHLKITVTQTTEKGKPSFKDDVLKKIDHPVVKLLRRGKKYKSLHSKFKKYAKCVDNKGVLRYALHQLRASRNDDADAGETGTVVGRFTSTEIVPGVGINIQQVMKPEKQFKSFGDEYFIRELHIPSPGMRHFSADAEQIQYRLFAHEANNKSILEAYANEDPNDPKTWISYHKMMLGKLRVHKPDLAYGKCKDTNFAKLFAAGPSKLGLMLEFITQAQYQELKAQKANRFHPWLKEVLEILKIYDKEVPEVDALTKDHTNVAEKRGYIKSIMGRRMRFPNGHRSHKALNGRIIMSEADIVKTKAVELYRSRKATGLVMRFQVHDEYDGDVPNDESGKKVAAILNHQSFSSLRVRILWGAKTGDNWGACAAEEIRKLREEASL